jgi:hypothetical protein
MNVYFGMTYTTNLQAFVFLLIGILIFNKFEEFIDAV